MAINTIEYNKIMMRKLDQHAQAKLTSGWMEANAGLVQYDGGDEVKIPTLTTAGLADYSRNDGFVKGGIDFKYNTYKLTQDRGRTFYLDRMDVNETNFTATSANLLKVFQEEEVVPEIDAYRYSKIANKAEEANQLDTATLTADNALSKLLEHIRAVQDVVGMDTQLVITLPSLILGLIEDAKDVHKYVNVGEFKQGSLNLRVKMIDGLHPLRVVPSARLKTLYKINDGTTVGQEEGGLVPDDTAKDINYLITPVKVPIAVSKTDKIRVFDPDTNQTGDGWKLDYRKYHELWILKQKEKQIFASVKGA